MLPTPPTKTRLPDEIDELTTLARQIRDTHEEAQAEATGAREQANRAITAALLCGKSLARAKELVGHGNWLKWVADHCKDISEDTVQRYMRLSKTAHVRNLEGKSLRQAYIEAGIIQETPCAKPQPEPTVSSVQSSEPESEPLESNPFAEPVEQHAEQMADAPTPHAGQGEQQIALSVEPHDSLTWDGIQPDPYARLRQLVGYVMGEVEKLGDGAKGGIVGEIMPIVLWAQKRNLI